MSGARSPRPRPAAAVMPTPLGTTPSVRSIVNSQPHLNARDLRRRRWPRRTWSPGSRRATARRPGRTWGGRGVVSTSPSRSPHCSAACGPPSAARTPGTCSATASTSSGGGRFGVAVRRPAPTSAGAGGAGGDFGGAAARLAAALFHHLAEAFELEALIVLSRDIQLLGRSVGVADGEL
jgi:hypothetical protein